MKKLLSKALLLCLPLAAAAQQEIDTDRPDQTETPSIVPLKHFQMENGFTHKHESAEGHHNNQLPSSLWKYGISRTTELRLITTFVYDKTPDSTSTGLAPVIVGAKVALWAEKGWLPKASVIGQILLPDAPSRDLSAVYLAPEIRLLFQNTLSESLDLGYNIGIFWDGESTKTQYTYTFSPCIDIAHSAKAYVESYGFLKTSRHPEHWIDGGFMLLLGKDVQLDVSAGYELTSPGGHSHSTYESLGISFRI